MYAAIKTYIILLLLGGGENIQIVNVNCINSRTTEVTCYSSQAEKQAEGQTTYEYMMWPLGPLKQMQTLRECIFLSYQKFEFE